MYLARDNYGLRLFLEPPTYQENIRGIGRWVDNHVYFHGSSNFVDLPVNWFPFVTFENSPFECSIVPEAALDDINKCKVLEGDFSEFVDNNFEDLIGK